MAIDTHAVFKGDWRTLPPSCDGTVEVWDQTVGCPQCKMNMWYTPGSEVNGADPSSELPLCSISTTCACSVIGVHAGTYDDTALWELFRMVHPFQFDDCHDDGDEDDGATHTWREPLREAMTSDH